MSLIQTFIIPWTHWEWKLRVKWFCIFFYPFVCLVFVLFKLFINIFKSQFTDKYRYCWRKYLKLDHFSYSKYFFCIRIAQHIEEPHLYRRLHLSAHTLKCRLFYQSVHLFCLSALPCSYLLKYICICISASASVCLPSYFFCSATATTCLCCSQTISESIICISLLNLSSGSAARLSAMALAFTLALSFWIVLGLS